MGRIRLNVMDHLRGTKTRVDVPDDVPVKKLIPALVKRLGLPSQHNGNPVAYSLDNRLAGESLEDERTLAENGIEDDAVLAIFSVVLEDIRKEAKSLLNDADAQYSINLERATKLDSFLSARRSRSLKIFVSYSRNDIDIAKNIYQFLRDNGFNVWMDIFDLVPGQDWKLEIHARIKSSDYFVACLSNNSVSKRGYVQTELREALSILETMPEGRIYVVPIRIDDCLVPSSLDGKHWLDWSAPDAREKLLMALKSKT